MLYLAYCVLHTNLHVFIYRVHFFLPRVSFIWSTLIMDYLVADSIAFRSLLKCHKNVTMGKYLS